MGMSNEILPKEVTLEAIESIVNKSISGLATKESLSGLATKESLSGLATYVQLLETEKRLEKQIDDLAISTGNEFGRVYVKLDEMNNCLMAVDEHLIVFEADSKMRFTGLQNQLDNVYNNYPNRHEFDRLDKRVKRVEKVAFA